MNQMQKLEEAINNMGSNQLDKWRTLWESNWFHDFMCYGFQKNHRPITESLPIKEIKARRRKKAGYEIRTELIDGEPFGTEDCELQSAYTFKGEYIGGPDEAKEIMEKRGIQPELADKNHSVCSIGFCESEDKWYGWSHRAIFGWAPGDKITEGMSGFEDLPQEMRRVGYEIKNHEEARTVAKVFARSVS